MVIWITGRANSGKTTMAKAMAQSSGALVLDGDDVRKYFPTGYSDEERLAHILRVAKIAALAEAQGFLVIVACVSPKKAWRQQARSLFQCSNLVYLPGGHLWDGSTYEEPDLEELS